MKQARIGILAITLLWPTYGIAEEKVPMIFATVGTATPGVTVVDGQVDVDRPGWFAELSRRAASDCGAELEFAFMPWARVLESVERGEVAAGFNSSYKTKRTVYAVYPMKNDKPDEGRASKFYAYYAYLPKSSADRELRENAEVKNRRILVERKGSIISELEKRGAKIFEAASYLTMLRMAASGDRVDAAVGIEHNLDGALEPYPDLAAKLQKSEKPIEKKVGYVMFSKMFYKKYSDVAECFWTTSAQLKSTAWFKKMRSSYD
jgi:polar amino acid transport system substrate-binding protein